MEEEDRWGASLVFFFFFKFMSTTSHTLCISYAIHISNLKHVHLFCKTLLLCLYTINLQKKPQKKKQNKKKQNKNLQVKQSLHFAWLLGYIYIKNQLKFMYRIKKQNTSCLDVFAHFKFKWVYNWWFPITSKGWI